MRVIESKQIYTGWPPITQDTVEFGDGTQKSGLRYILAKEKA